MQHRVLSLIISTIISITFFLTMQSQSATQDWVIAQISILTQFHTRHQTTLRQTNKKKKLIQRQRHKANFDILLQPKTSCIFKWACTQISWTSRCCHTASSYRARKSVHQTILEKSAEFAWIGNSQDRSIFRDVIIFVLEVGCVCLFEHVGINTSSARAASECISSPYNFHNPNTHARIMGHSRSGKLFINASRKQSTHLNHMAWDVSIRAFLIRSCLRFSLRRLIVGWAGRFWSMRRFVDKKKFDLFLCRTCLFDL